MPAGPWWGDRQGTGGVGGPTSSLHPRSRWARRGDPRVWTQSGHGHTGHPEGWGLRASPALGTRRGGAVGQQPHGREHPHGCERPHGCEPPHGSPVRARRLPSPAAALLLSARGSPPDAPGLPPGPGSREKPHPRSSRSHHGLVLPPVLIKQRAF